ncbi:hypothetical protein Lal_00024294 [Lupinus albus]|nr:hypothetical protein Lal_00024294 [Lupinus albus]
MSCIQVILDISILSYFLTARMDIDMMFAILLYVLYNTKRNRVTIKDSLCFRLQARRNEAETLLRSMRLFQQFVRLNWVRNNQAQLRVDKYSNLNFTSGLIDSQGANKGKRIILPSSFVGGRRYMDQLYFDGMAISSFIGFPDLFIMFTCNPNWLEINRLLSPMQLKPQDRPYIISRVFKIKFDQFLMDLKKYRVLGKIEFQKKDCLMLIYFYSYIHLSINNIKLYIFLKPFSIVYTFENHATYLEQKFATSLEPKLATSLEPKLATSLEPKLATSLEPKLATSLEPKLATSLEPKLATLLEPKSLTNHGRLKTNLQLTNQQLQNLTLLEIENLLQINRKSLRNYPSMPYPEGRITSQLGNRLIYAERDYDKEELKAEFIHCFNLLTDEQMIIFDKVMKAVNDGNDGTFFLYGYDSIASALCSENHIVLTMTSSGIASLLLPEGRTTHSKLAIPVPTLENSTCNIHQGSELVVSHISTHVIETKVMTRKNVGNIFYIPRMSLSPSHSLWPFKLTRRQFSLIVSYAMTINKSQGQSLASVGLYLLRPVFGHGKLYVAFSRVQSMEGLKILIHDKEGKTMNTTINVVFKEVFQNL